MGNLEIWDKFKQPPQEALRSFNNGSFKGTDINTMWRMKMLTEQFGICGVGWYYDVIRTWTDSGVNGEVMCFAEIKLYVKVDGEWSKGISGTGGSKIIDYFSSKKYNASSDEGYKKAITDAFGVACKHLGIGASIYWANDVTKYTKSEDIPKSDQIPLTEPMINTIRNELERVGMSEKEFLSKVNFVKLGDIPVSGYASIMTKFKTMKDKS